MGGARTTAGTPPSNTAAPVISGSAEQGKTLSTSSGSWSGTTPMTYTYQWQRCDSARRELREHRWRDRADVHGCAARTCRHKLVAVVTAHNSAGTGSKPSAATAVVTGATPPSNTVQPTITGSAAVGWTLSTSTGTWSGTAPITYTYIWRRCATNGAWCVSIGGATARTYQLVNADAGHTIRVAVTATNVGGSGQATSNATNTVAVTAPGNTTAPAITGTPTQGQTLTVSSGEWIGATPITYTYAWQRCDSSGKQLRRYRRCDKDDATYS